MERKSKKEEENQKTEIKPTKKMDNNQLRKTKLTKKTLLFI